MTSPGFSAPASSSFFFNKLSFPCSLYLILDTEDASVVQWCEDGKCVKIVDSLRFEQEICPKYFNHCKYSSIQRQLNLYGFRCLKRNELKGVFFHPEFKKGHYQGVVNMKRIFQHRRRDSKATKDKYAKSIKATKNESSTSSLSPTSLISPKEMIPSSSFPASIPCQIQLSSNVEVKSEGLDGFSQAVPIPDWNACLHRTVSLSDFYLNLGIHYLCNESVPLPTVKYDFTCDSLNESDHTDASWSHSEDSDSMSSDSNDDCVDLRKVSNESSYESGAFEDAKCCEDEELFSILNSL